MLFDNGFSMVNVAFVNLIGIKIVKVMIVLVVVFFAKKIAYKFIRKAFDNPRNKMSERKKAILGHMFEKLAKYTINFLAICQIFSVFGADMSTVLAVTGVGSIAIGFAAQGLVKDFITGMFIILEDQFGIGDIVTINGFTGKVESIGMRTTKLRGIDEQASLYIIPNSVIGIVTNASTR